MVEGVFSFHVMREACLADRADGWRQLARRFAPLARQLLQHYFPTLEQAALLAGVFREAKAKQAQLWRTFTGTSEKEFLLHFRRFVMEQARASRGAQPPTPLSPESFWALLKEFPALQREMLVLSFRRYPPEALNMIMKFEPATTRAAVEQALEKISAALGQALGPDFCAHDHDALFAAIEQQRDDNCLPDKLYARILDGQITWREREEAERHRGSCLYCLNRFAEFREADYFYRTLAPLDDSRLAAAVAALGLPDEEPVGKKPWWLRLIGG